jgi:hypothetical protein
MRTLLLILLLAAALLPANAAQESAGEAALRERVTVRPLAPTSLKQALEQLFEGTGATVELDPEVVNVGFGPGWLDLRNVRRQDALRVLLRAASVGGSTYSYQQEGSKITVRKDPTPVEPPAAKFRTDPRLAGKRTFVEAERVPLRRGPRLIGNMPVPLVVLPHVSDLPISLSARDVPVDQLLDDVVRQLQAQHRGARFVWSAEGEVYVLDVRKAGGR